MPVTLRGPVRILLMLRADDLLDLGLHQLDARHVKPETDAQREQALPRRADELTKRLLNLRR